MKKTIFLLIILLMLMQLFAVASFLIPANENALENANSPGKSQAIGENWDLEKVEFIHYAKPFEAGKPPKQDACYKLMGVKWLSFPVTYTINPTNLQGLTENFITSAILSSAETWDDSTSRELFNNIYGIDYSAAYGVYDSQNSIVFGDYPNSGVIGVTSVWYSRIGKQIVEFDMLFNTDFSWGDATIDSAKMDLKNIATHELGHSVGLDDIYSSSCSGVTMYGYSSEGEVIRRSLESADIAGLQKMYGV